MSGDFEIGYKRPPKTGQFQKGQSGNPKGRPKGVKNLKTDLEEELQEQIFVREGEVRQMISKQRAMLKSLTAKAVQGDTRAVGLVVDMVYRLLHGGDLEPPEDSLDEEDPMILEAYAERQGRDGSKTKAPSPQQSLASPQANQEERTDDQ